MKRFSWPSYPTNEAEFEALMQAIDASLVEEGLMPFQRPLNVPRKLGEAFGWSGNVLPPDALADSPSFKGEALMAKSHRWYRSVYGEQLKSPGAYGFAPARLGNGIWRVRLGVVFGRVELFADRNLSNRGRPRPTGGLPATMNVLCAVTDLPQGLADRLSERDLREHLEWHVYVHENMQWRSELPGIELFETARADYDQSTEDVLAHRYGQARWGAQQAVEKTVKGLLLLGGTPYPTRGPNGHNLRHLGGLLLSAHGIRVPDVLLDAAGCSTKVRYGEEPSTASQALLANHAVQGVMEHLRRSKGVPALLAKATSKAT